MKKNWLQLIITLTVLFSITTGLYLYTAGFRLSKEEAETGTISLTKTGMIGAKSIPDGATIYLNGELVNATDATIPGINPGTHTLMIVKNGFVEWIKDVEVFPELVTDITAVLVSKSPRFEPLTNTGAAAPSISPSLTKLAYFSEDETSPGVWVIPLSGEVLSLFRTNPYVVIENTPFRFFSRGKSIEWSPDEKDILIETQNGTYFLVDLTQNTALATASPDEIREEWNAEIQEKRQDFISTLNIPEELQEIAVEPSTQWAPDEKKFLYTLEVGDQIQYKVYNMEKPIPVGEKVETVVFTTNASDPQPQVTWYSDSFHLVLLEGFSEETPQGVISLVRIDGTNKTEVYSGNIYSDKVYTSPGGEKLIFLTSFKSSEQTDLYTVSIR